MPECAKGRKLGSQLLSLASSAFLLHGVLGPGPLWGGSGRSSCFPYVPHSVHVLTSPSPSFPSHSPTSLSFIAHRYVSYSPCCSEVVLRERGRRDISAPAPQCPQLWLPCLLLLVLSLAQDVFSWCKPVSGNGDSRAT